MSSCWKQWGSGLYLPGGPPTNQDHDGSMFQVDAHMLFIYVYTHGYLRTTNVKIETEVDASDPALAMHLKSTCAGMVMANNASLL